MRTSRVTLVVRGARLEGRKPLSVMEMSGSRSGHARATAAPQKLRRWSALGEDEAVAGGAEDGVVVDDEEAVVVGEAARVDDADVALHAGWDRGGVVDPVVLAEGAARDLADDVGERGRLNGARGPAVRGDAGVDLSGARAQEAGEAAGGAEATGPRCGRRRRRRAGLGLDGEASEALPTRGRAGGRARSSSRSGWAWR
ncbi:MAG: hypothetical protein R3F14_22255 [Polyangiaceae bacterium]